MLWLTDKLRPVERGVKGWPKKSEVIAFGQHEIELKYSQLHPLTSTGAQPDFRRFRTASPPLTRRESASESADFPRLFRIFCTRTCAQFFPQRLRSDFAGISELSREEKWRKASESSPLRKTTTRLPLAGRRSPFPLIHVEQLVRAARSGAAEFSALWIDRCAAAAIGMDRQDGLSSSSEQRLDLTLPRHVEHESGRAQAQHPRYLPGGRAARVQITTPFSSNAGLKFVSRYCHTSGARA
jgi:hypothetical protein